MQPNVTRKQLEQHAASVRRSIITMLEQAGSGHTAGALGLADIMTALYFAVLHVSPENPDWDERDLFVMSNGHCAPVVSFPGQNWRHSDSLALDCRGIQNVKRCLALRRLAGHWARA